MPHEVHEQVEHHQHAAHSPFDRRVAMTMTIVAAMLACMTMLGHRAHNETLRLGAEAGTLQTQASDKWSYYQAKNIREHEYKAYLQLVAVLAKDPMHEEKTKSAVADWSKQVAKYEAELPKLKEEAEELEKEAARLKAESHHHHARAMKLDFGELGVELALVLCSVAVLTKRSWFWYAGIIAGAIGLIVGLVVFLPTSA
jgi:uncharacterized protein DUF4337